MFSLLIIHYQATMYSMNPLMYFYAYGLTYYCNYEDLKLISFEVHIVKVSMQKVFDI